EPSSEVDRVVAGRQPDLPPVVTGGGWFPVGLPEIREHRRPDARHVGDERPVQRLAAAPVVPAEEVLEPLLELFAILVAYPNQRDLGRVVSLGGDAEQKPLRSWSCLVGAELLQRVEFKWVAPGAFDRDDHPDCLELAQPELLASLVLLGQRGLGAVLDGTP